jgi:hypothetical protein
VKASQLEAFDSFTSLTNSSGSNQALHFSSKLGFSP